MIGFPFFFIRLGAKRAFLRTSGFRCEGETNGSLCRQREQECNERGERMTADPCGVAAPLVDESGWQFSMGLGRAGTIS